MQHKRRTAFLLVLIIPLVWALSGWSALPSVINVSPASRQQADPFIQSIINRVSKDEWRDIVRGLSGDQPVTIGGQPVVLKTRYTPSAQGTLSEQYVYEYFQTHGLAASYHSWSGNNARCIGVSGRNVIAEIKGSKDPGRIYMLTAHLDSISPRPAEAPGADDDGSGTTAVMVAAKLLKSYGFDYTVRFVAFTGEERGLCGSGRYAADARSRNENIQGVINLDMIAYDSDGVKDVEIHAGTRGDSRAIADLLIANMAAYQLNLIPHLLTDTATNLSDHASFWNNNYPALAAAEYLFSGDGNPFIHSVRCCDTWEHLDLDMGTDYTKAAIATISMLGGVQSGAQEQPTALPPTTVASPTSAATPVPTVAIPGIGTHTFPETGKALSGLFLDYWRNNGGLAQQGYPISEVFGELSDLNGKPYTVQYFERAVFEYHPENQPPFNVLLSQLGTFQYKRKYPNGAPDQKPNNDLGSVLFRETGKRVGGKFLDYWKAHGGLPQQGYPISDEFTEVSDLNGKPYTVQYFERAVFEHHPENQPPNDVLLSQLGTFRYRQMYGAR